MEDEGSDRTCPTATRPTSPTRSASIPIRWTPENEAKILRNAYLPSVRAARLHRQPRCAMEAQLVLATLVQRVTFELVPGQTVALEPSITAGFGWWCGGTHDHEVSRGGQYA